MPTRAEILVEERVAYYIDYALLQVGVRNGREKTDKQCVTSVTKPLFAHAPP